MRRFNIAAVLLLGAIPCLAQAPGKPPSDWSFKTRFELRANVRDSHEAKFPLRFPFPPEFLPVGQTVGFEETPEAGRHVELSVVQVRLDALYGTWFGAHAQLHVQDLYRRNPTSSDRKVDADEAWVRFGEKPEFLDRPEKSSFFVQVGKAPKMERQPTRLLESYGLAATAFNRFEDLQALAGGTIGRNLYWRLQLANGNPLFFRDSNALAGDNGTPSERQPGNPHPVPRYHSGFPILYNAEVEEYVFNTSNLQFGQAVGYRWQNQAQTFGYDAIAFHYRRSLADEKNLTGTFYSGDLDLLRGPFDAFPLPITDRKKEETGIRIYSEWHHLTTTVQYTRQHLAGLHRAGYELETGYQIPFAFGPQVGGESLFQYVQPAFRVSGLTNDFRARADKRYPAPSVWWPWTKLDYGLRIGFARNVDLTLEHAKHNVGAPRKLNMSESLLTLRVRV